MTVKRSTPNRETRRGLVEIRAAEIDGGPGVTLHAIRPGVVDDYGSLWRADAFDASLAERLPTLCWSHQWNEPLGPGKAYRTGPDGPEVDFAFSDFEAVPIARRAHAQVSDGTIEDCSVGFSNVRRRDPSQAEIDQYPGIREVIEEATLDEISLVLRGAVPGAKVMAVRSARTGEMVEVDSVVAIAEKVAAGEISQAAADEALRLLSSPGTGTPPVESGDGTATGDGTGEPLPELDEVLAEADAAIAAIADRSRR